MIQSVSVDHIGEADVQFPREFLDFRPIITKPDTGRLCIRITPGLDCQVLHLRPTLLDDLIRNPVEIRVVTIKIAPIYTILLEQFIETIKILLIVQTPIHTLITVRVLKSFPHKVY